MQSVQLFTAKQKVSTPSPQQTNIAKNVIRTCLAVRPGEKLLTLSDYGKKDIASIFFETAKSFTNFSEMILIPDLSVDAQEPPQEAFQRILLADVVIFVTNKSLTHTQARRQASSRGIRIVNMPGITKEIFARTLDLNYTEISASVKKLTGFLTQANKARLSSENGTHVIFSLEGRDALAETGLYTDHSDFGDLPAGEAYISPKEDKTNGTIVFDSIFTQKKKFTEPMELVVNRGKIVDIKGSRAQALHQELQKIGPEGHFVAEIGIGANPAAKIESSRLEAEKAFGTVHIALGSNIHLSGEIDLPFHADGFIKKPTLALESNLILQNGEFVF